VYRQFPIFLQTGAALSGQMCPL